MPDPPATAGHAARLSPEQLDALADLDPETIRALGQPTGGPSLTRRAALGAGGLASLLALGAGGAAGAPQPNGGEGDFGSPSSPWEGWADGLAHVSQSFNSAGTLTKQVALLDSAVAPFTVTVGQELEPQSGFSLPVVLIDQTGNCGTNTVTVDTESGNGIDGGTSIDIDHDNAITELWWDGNEYRTDWFTVTVDAGLVKTPEVQDGSGNTVLGQRVASGATVLSSGSATIDTGVSESTTATFYVALGPDTDDAVVAAEIRAASGGNYEVDIEETETDVGNPTIRYDIVRVR